MFSSVQSVSPVWLFATPWTSALQASLSITNSRSPPKLMCIESVMPSNQLILCWPLLLLPPIPPSIRVFSNESALRIRWPKYWSFSFSISPSNEHLSSEHLANRCIQPFFPGPYYVSVIVVELVVRNPLANAGDVRDVGLIPGSGRSLGEGNGKPLQYSGLENPMDRGAWWATGHGVAKGRTRLSMQPFFPESPLCARHCDELWYWKATKTLLLIWKGSQPCETEGRISVESIHLFVF